MEKFQATKWKTHFTIKTCSHWYEMECKRCEWTIAVPKQEASEVIADRRSQMGEHIEGHLTDD